MHSFFARITTVLILICFFFSSTLSPALAAVNYLYDANGNMTSDGTKCFEYNEANQLKKVKKCSDSQPIAEYVYDFEGNRLVKKEYENGVLKHTVFSPHDEYELKKLPSGATQSATYYKANDEIVAKKNPDGTKYYFHNDHLGSNTIITDQNRIKIEETKYDPWGKVSSGGTTSKFQYTNQEKDLETGLNYYGARYYDSHIRRFTQADSMLPNIYDPQQLNRYAYVRNNPLRYTDPTGHFLFAIPVGYWIAGAAVTAFSTYLALPQGQKAVKSTSAAAARGLDKIWTNTHNMGKSIASNIGNSSSNTNRPSSGNSSPRIPNNNLGNAVGGAAGVASAVTQKLHGNNLNNKAITTAYTLRERATGAIQKFGETIYPATRYSQRWLDKNNLILQRESSGSKLDMRIWEHEHIGEYIFKYGEAPLLNDISRSVNVLR